MPSHTRCHQPNGSGVLAKPQPLNLRLRRMTRNKRLLSQRALELKTLQNLLRLLEVAIFGNQHIALGALRGMVGHLEA